MTLIDSHCHLDDDRFEAGRDGIVERANRQGIEQIILPATTAERWRKVKQVAEKYSGVFPAYGLHPMFMAQHEIQNLDELDTWIKREAPVAVGECGLDFYQSRSDEQRQIQFFIEHLEIANRYQLPVIVHVRKAMDRVISLLRKYNPVAGGVIHSFAGSLQQAQQLLGLGFKLGIAATVDFERAKKLRRVVAEIDESALLLESDAPDQPGVNHRGELNEPAFVVEHFQTMAQLRGISEDRMRKTLNKNTRALFKL